MRIPLLLSVVLASSLAFAQAQPARKPPNQTPDVIFVPTPQEVVDEMLRLADVKKGDVLYDLGSGDGRIPVTAAKKFGVRAVGIEYDPAMAKRAQCLVQVEGVADRVRIIEGDIFKENFGGPGVVTLYLLPQLNLCVRHRLLALEPGTRIVSHQFEMGKWKPEKVVEVNGRSIYFWTVPARPEKKAKGTK